MTTSTGPHRLDCPVPADLESVSTHTVPSWYDDAKLGVFLHWGLYSVPVAPQVDDIQQLLRDEGPEAMRANPYAEWYPQLDADRGQPDAAPPPRALRDAPTTTSSPCSDDGRARRTWTSSPGLRTAGARYRGAHHQAPRGLHAVALAQRHPVRAPTAPSATSSVS